MYISVGPSFLPGICLYYCITSNICMRRRLNVCHTLFTSCHTPSKAPPPLDHLAPHDHFLPLFAFAFMCGANSSCHASGLRLPTPDCPAKQMQIAAKIFRTFTKLSWIPGHQSNPPTCQIQSPNCDSYLSFSANECSNLAWKSAPNLQAPPPPHPIGNQRRWKALFR